MKRFRYTAEHIEFLRTGYLSMNVHDLTKAFNKKFKMAKPETSIKSTLKNHKIRCGRAHKDRLINRLRLFTPDQVRFLRDNYEGRSIAEMTDLFNKKFRAEITRQQIRSAVKNRHITSGRTGQFKKGHRSWNKGKKGYMGPNRTSFKKGSIPANERPIGSERICSKDGYVWIKVEEWDHNFNRPTRWKHKHVHIWEKENGPVPDGHAVIFRDGDKLNIDPPNLMLVTRAELLRLNQYGYKDTPGELKPSVLALAKLEVKVFSIDKII